MRNHPIASSLVDVGELREGVGVLVEVARIAKLIRAARQTRESGLIEQTSVVRMLQADGMTELMQKGDAVEAAGRNRILETAVIVLIRRPVDGHQPFV